MSENHIEKSTVRLDVALNAACDTAAGTKGPVLMDIPGKGQFVIMSQDAFAELLDKAQTITQMDVDNDPLLQSIKDKARE